MAAHAASFTAWGAAKSGNPCDRLTALCASLSRVISRMTDSVNCRAFLDPVTLDIDVLKRSSAFRLCSAGLQACGRGVGRSPTRVRILRGALALLGGGAGWRRRGRLRLGRGGRARFLLRIQREIDVRRIRGLRGRWHLVAGLQARGAAVQTAIVLGVGEDLSHVGLRLVERDVVNEIFLRQIGTLLHPAMDASIAGVVCSQHQVHLAEVLELIGQIRCPNTDVRLRRRQQLAEYVRPRRFAYCRAVVGSSCINPTAFAGDRMLATNVDSCAIRAATTNASSPFCAEYL